MPSFLRPELPSPNASPDPSASALRPWRAAACGLIWILWSGTSAAAEPAAKNWAAPAQRIEAQALSDAITASHPELLSVTFHGTPPGLTGVYTMFAGSYPERIGNPDDPDDIMVIETGITILDPRWHRTKDKVAKFVVQLPLRDRAGANVGLLVLAYRNLPGTGRTDGQFLQAATALRDQLATSIPTYAGLFQPAP